jgi:hypothetical protein
MVHEMQKCSGICRRGAAKDRLVPALDPRSLSLSLPQFAKLLPLRGGTTEPADGMHDDDDEVEDDENEEDHVVSDVEDEIPGRDDFEVQNVRRICSDLPRPEESYKDGETHDGEEMHVDDKTIEALEEETLASIKRLDAMYAADSLKEMDNAFRPFHAFENDKEDFPAQLLAQPTDANADANANANSPAETRKYQKELIGTLQDIDRKVEELQKKARQRGLEIEQEALAGLTRSQWQASPSAVGDVPGLPGGSEDSSQDAQDAVYAITGKVCQASVNDPKKNVLIKSIHLLHAMATLLRYNSALTALTAHVCHV